MNGCCMTHSECPCHGGDCYFYWPCGCKKERASAGSTAKPHTHHYSEKHAPNDPRFRTVTEDDDDEG